MKTILGLVLALLAALAAMPSAMAQTHSFTPACRAQCNPVSRDLAGNSPAVQACLIRCQAGSDFTRGANAAPRRMLGTTPTVALAAPPSTGSWGVIYAATPPNPAIGASQGQRDRNMAHVAAEQACFVRANVHCRPLAEAGPGECVAAAQAVRLTGLMRTSDPRTIQVTLVEYGKGNTEAQAERAALAACSGRGTCELVAMACGSH